MLKDIQAKKGILLFMVLGMILIIVILAVVILSIISSQSRLTHHQVSRIQAFYAAQAGMNYAVEMLRIGPAGGGWDVTSCPPPGGCPLNDADFPHTIVQPIIIIIKSTGGDPSPEGSGPIMPNSAPIIVTVDYTAP